MTPFPFKIEHLKMTKKNQLKAKYHEKKIVELLDVHSSSVCIEVATHYTMKLFLVPSKDYKISRSFWRRVTKIVVPIKVLLINNVLASINDTKIFVTLRQNDRLIL